MRKELPKKFPKPKQGSAMWVDLDVSTRRRWSLFPELPKRLHAVMKMVPFIAASETYLNLMDYIPGGPRWASYRNSLSVTRFGGAKAPFPTFGVYSHPTRLRDREIDSERSVLYVRPKKNFAAPVRPEVQILHKFSPWTMGTLPFSPKRNEAVLVVRRVSKREVQHIAKQRLKDQPEWRKLLEKAGAKNVNLNKTPPELKTKIIHDLAFDALRLELGYGGAKAVPHWRPSIYMALNYIRRLFKSKSVLSTAITNPRSYSWRKWPPRAESSIKIDALKSIQKFQKRMHVRV